MCELGSQGGMDGRWHCSAAQVEMYLFQHADIVVSTSCQLHSVSFLPSLIVVHMRPSLSWHVLLIDKGVGGGTSFLGFTFLWHVCTFMWVIYVLSVDFSMASFLFSSCSLCLM